MPFKITSSPNTILPTPVAPAGFARTCALVPRDKMRFFGRMLGVRLRAAVLPQLGRMGVVLAAPLLLAASPLVLGDKTSDITEAAEKATSEYKNAESKAQQAQKDTPLDKAEKSAEDALDKAEQNRDDTNANPNATKEQKDAADKAVKDAKAKADSAENGKDTSAIRDALEKRRAARKKLKEARKKLADLLQRQRKFLDASVWRPTSNILKALDEALKRAEAPLLAIAGLPHGENSLSVLASAGKIKLTTSGTGETIGHVADCKIQNLTDQPLTCSIPPMVLESGSGKNQHYACPRGQSVALKPDETKTVPINGVCLNHNKPPVGKGVSGDLVVNDGKPVGPDAGTHLPANDVAKVLGSCAAKYAAVDQLQKSGALKSLPYPDPQKQKDICVEWSVWTDPEIAKTAGSPPATKEDLRKVVYKQVEEGGPMTPATKKKVDQGIDTIFAKVELTTAKAKDLEAANPPVGGPAPGTVNIDNPPKPEASDVPDPGLPPPPKGVHTPNPLYEWIQARRSAELAEEAYDANKEKLRKNPGASHIIRPEDVEKAKEAAEAARKKADKKAGDVKPADRKEQLQKELDDARDRAKRARSNAEDDKKSADSARADEKRLRGEGKKDLANGRAGDAARFETQAEERTRIANSADKRAEAIQAEMEKSK